MAVLVESEGLSEGREFLSPLRILVRSFRRSRDKWKAKAGQWRVDNKRLKVSVHDVKLSRAAWRARAEEAEGELAALRARTAPSAAPLAEVPPKKKRRAAS